MSHWAEDGITGQAACPRPSHVSRKDAAENRCPVTPWLVALLQWQGHSFRQRYVKGLANGSCFLHNMELVLSPSWHGDLLHPQQRPPSALPCLGVSDVPWDTSSCPSPDPEWSCSLTNAFRVAFRDGGTPVKFRPAQDLIGLVVLLLKPVGDRAEVLQEGPSIHLIRASEVEEDFLPRLGRPSFQRFPTEERVSKSQHEARGRMGEKQWWCLSITRAEGAIPERDVKLETSSEAPICPVYGD